MLTKIFKLAVIESWSEQRVGSEAYMIPVN